VIQLCFAKDENAKNMRGAMFTTRERKCLSNFAPSLLAPAFLWGFAEGLADDGTLSSRGIPYFAGTRPSIALANA
jgi:hypothetical protein